jgi:chaperonin GroES
MNKCKRCSMSVYCVSYLLPHKTMQIDFEPIGDRVIVKPLDDELEQKTKSGLLIAVRDNANRELPQSGEIVALGKGMTYPGCPNPSDVFKVGDVVYFGRYAGEEFTVGDPHDKDNCLKFISLRLDAVFGRLNNKPAATDAK